MKQKMLYRVTIQGQEDSYEVYARSVSESDLFGFIVLEELVFGETSAILVDPRQERMKGEFHGVKATYLPMHSILRIDEIEENIAKYENAKKGNNVSQFPPHSYNKLPDNLN
jgi:hypothetical protein